jgi:hypothetical protein
VLIWLRAAITLAGVCGSSTTLDALTSRARPAQPDRYDREMPRQPAPETVSLFGTVSPSGNPCEQCGGGTLRSR